MENNVPQKPANSFRLTLELNDSQPRLDSVLLENLRNQDRNAKLAAISRNALKQLFKDSKIQIKGQNARPSSALSRGITYVDILGFQDA